MCQYLWNLLLAPGEAKKLTTEIKALGIGVKLSWASNRILQSGQVVITFKNKPVCNDFPVF